MVQLVFSWPLVGYFVGSESTQFKSGYDPRRKARSKDPVVAHGMTMPELCQQWTEASVQLLGQIVTNTDDQGEPCNKPYASASRIKAAIALLDRAHGKPESVLKLAEMPSSNQGVTHLPTSQLISMIQADTVNVE